MTKFRFFALSKLTPAAIVATALATLVLAAGGARAEGEADGSRLRGFEPALTLGFGVHSQDLRGSQSADFAEMNSGKQGKLRFSFSEAEAMLFSPTLTETLGLRLFLRGGGQLPFTAVQLSSNTTASFNTPDQLDPTAFSRNCAPLPQPEPGNSRPNFSAGFCSVRGQNEMVVNGSIFAGLGLDLTLPIGSYQFHLRPSINYVGQSLRGEGQTTRLTTAEETINCPANQPPPDGKPCADLNRPGTERYTVKFSQSEEVRARTGERWLHGIGPRLELDIEVAKVGDLVFEFFAQTGIYWLLTDRVIEFQGYGATGPGVCRQTNPDNLTITPPDYCTPTRPGGEPLNAFYRSRAGPVIVQGGGGFRVVWKGLGL